jgi:hypothetical protein
MENGKDAAGTKPEYRTVTSTARVSSPVEIARPVWCQAPGVAPSAPPSEAIQDRLLSRGADLEYRALPVGPSSRRRSIDIA